MTIRGGSGEIERDQPQGVGDTEPLPQRFVDIISEGAAQSWQMQIQAMEAEAGIPPFGWRSSSGAMAQPTALKTHFAAAKGVRSAPHKFSDREQKLASSYDPGEHGMQTSTAT
jgi:hypothetical protein